MTNKQERNLYQLIAIGCFLASIFLGSKYLSVKSAYQKESKAKVWYCKEYHALKCQSIQDSIMIEDVSLRSQNDNLNKQ